MAAIAAALLCIALPARAQLVAVGEGPVSWELGGYLRSFSAMSEPGLVLPGQEVPQVRHVDLLRLEHRLFLGPMVGVEVHNRLAWTQGAREGGVGVDVTPPPDRSLDLRSVLVETPSTVLDHDVDRALVRLWFENADVVLGRQGITWGSAVLFTATDFWSPFSPFELDDSQKRGIDAARVTVPLSPRTEVEAVVADRGAARDVAGGLKVHHYGAVLDGWVGSVRLFEQVHVAGGLRGETGAWTLRGEGTLPVRFEEASGTRNPDTGVRPPRLTLGAERFGSKWMLFMEAHWNGEGAGAPGDYLARTADPDLVRGESFWLGRWYAGGMVAWLPVPDWTLTGGSFVNVGDPSTLMLAQVRYDVAESVEVVMGWYGGFGARSRLVFMEGNFNESVLSGVDVGSEFGLYGHTGFVQVAAFF